METTTKNEESHNGIREATKNLRILPTEKAIRANVLRYLLHRTDYLSKPLFRRARSVKELTEIAIRNVAEGYGLYMDSDGRIHAEKKPKETSPGHKDKPAQRGEKLNEKA